MEWTAKVVAVPSWRKWMESEHPEIFNTPVVAVLFRGDRILYVDEVVLLQRQRADGSTETAGFATLAPRGETGNSKIPEIVGVMILPKYRGQRISRPLLIKTLERCQARRWDKVKIEILNEKLYETTQRLPVEFLRMLSITYHGNIIVN